MENNNVAVKCENIIKEYPLFDSDFQRIKGLLFSRYKPKTFTALNNINVSFFKGEVIGIIGLNGSGKSTLSSIISGITYPTNGILEVNGDVSMLAANAGLVSHLTGVENIEYKGLLLGLNKKQIDSIRDEIIDFADIGVHINQPLRTYSSGMKSRLGFAISVSINPDILIIDEALAVGDTGFNEKCLKKINEFKEKGKTIIYVSHSVMQMQDFCDRVMWLHRGNMVGIDKPEFILKPYIHFTREYNAMFPEERKTFMPVLEDYQRKYIKGWADDVK